MSIETLNSRHENNPAWWAVEWLRKCCVGKKLDPNTVKPYSSLDEVIQRTALGKTPPLSMDAKKYLTPVEINLIETGQIKQIKKLAVIDIDGVIVNPWATISDCLLNGKSPRKAIENNRDFTGLRMLAGMLPLVDKIVLWTSRFVPKEGKTPEIFGNLGILDAFPFLAPETISKLENRYDKRVTVLAGEIKGFSNAGVETIIQTIESLGDPYVIYVGSSLFDLYRFKKMIDCLKKAEKPFDRFVFCTNGHLLF